MILSDFFQPLTPGMLAIFIFCLFVFDAIGIGTLKFIKINIDHLGPQRILVWLIGWGMLIFTWYVTGFFVSPTKVNVIISIIILALIFLPQYLIKREYLAITRLLINNKFFTLIFTPLVLLVFIEASRPPVEWDEMAYHFISPYSLRNLHSYWIFKGDLYFDLPRTLNLFYILSFSALHTYSFARLINFFVLITALFFTHLSIIKLFNKKSSIIFILLLLGIPQTLIQSATSGYVDMTANSLVLITLVNLLLFLTNTSKQNLFFTIIFSSLAAGVKYTSLLALGPIAAVVGLIFFTKNIRHKFFRPNTILLSLLLFLAFGGYWYLKNLYLFGNPIFPFFLPCGSGTSALCSQNTSFFGEWTQKINFQTIIPIIYQLLGGNIVTMAALFVTPFLIFFNKNNRTRAISLIIIFLIITEFAIMSKFSGYLFRYNQHLQFFIVFLISIQLANKFSSSFMAKFSSLFYLSIFLLTIPYYIFSIYYNYINVNLKQDSLYAFGVTDIYDWTNIHLQKTSKFLRWCEAQPPESPTPVVQIDPDMIWYRYEGLSRIYLTNCYFSSPEFTTKSIDKIDIEVEKSPVSLYMISLSGCQSDESLKPMSPEETNHIFTMRRTNNHLVCKSQNIDESLYLLKR